MLHDNLLTLRKLHQLSQEEVAERVGVSRQAVAKWESGETVPDFNKCMLLAQMYDVSLDNLANFDSGETNNIIPPKGRHLFGMVTVGEKGQIVIPKKAREVFSISPGDKLLVVGDESQGIAMIKEKDMLNLMQNVRNVMERADEM